MFECCVNDGRLIGFVPFVFVVAGVVVCFFLHICGDMRHTSVDNGHCARIRFNYVNLLFLCVMFAIQICQFNGHSAISFDVLRAAVLIEAVDSYHSELMAAKLAVKSVHELAVKLLHFAVEQ